VAKMVWPEKNVSVETTRVDHGHTVTSYLLQRFQKSTPDVTLELWDHKDFIVAGEEKLWGISRRAAPIVFMMMDRVPQGADPSARVGSATVNVGMPGTQEVAPVATGHRGESPLRDSLKQ
jgi:hypothetical protein